MATIRWRLPAARLAAWTVVGIAVSATAFGEDPEPLIPRLEFRVLDAGPEGSPLRQFRYRFEIHSAAEEEVVGQSLVVCQAADGVFRIPEPVSPYGRIGVWIEVDDLHNGYRYGFGSFSYRLDRGAATQPVPIRLRRGEVETGRVVDADTGKPIAGAKVAFEQTSPADPWADWDRRFWFGSGGGIQWDDATTTDRDGRFRVVALNIARLAARHPGYRDADDYDDFRWVNPGDPRPREQPRELVLKMHPLRSLRGRVVDGDGRPIAGVRIGRSADPNTSDVQGRFTVDVTSGEWRDRERRRIFLGSVDHGTTVVPLADFAFERETVVVLRSAPRWPVERARLDGDRQLRGRLVARVPLDEHNVPAVFLVPEQDERLGQEAPVQPDGSFTFSGIPDGRYTLRLHPTASLWRRMGILDARFWPADVYGVEPPNKPVEISVTIEGNDTELEPIDLHASGLLPGRVTGVAYQPGARDKPLANAFVCIGSPRLRGNATREPYHLLRFMTDADGRFQIDHCPPGRYVLYLTRRPSPYHYPDAWIWVRVRPETTTDLELLLSDPAKQLAIRFRVGDGSPAALYAGTGLDAQVVAKHRDPTTGQLPSILDDSERRRAKPSDIFCRLEPLDEAITHWPATAVRFEFSPWCLLENDPRHMVIPDVTPGRWRLTLTARTWSTTHAEETLLSRDFLFTEGMPPLAIDLPAAALAGTFVDRFRATSNPATIKAIPKTPELPTRTCEAGGFFRFVGLAPGTYSVRFEKAGRKPKQIDDVIVREGETTWVEHVVLEKAPPNE